MSGPLVAILVLAVLLNWLAPGVLRALAALVELRRDKERSPW